ncbi:MAG: M23 family metallopeptidase [Bdellovibrionales bacterium]|nr:M23 family metallopeptidase [Bdellovibrionales bacterium]
MKTRKKVAFLGLFLISACGPGADPLSNNGVCGNYPASSTSAYKVPWTVGTTQEIGQGNCSGFTHYGTSRYAYDIDMPIGTTIVAARAGTVIEVISNNSDGNGCGPGMANVVRIQHSDGTVAGYYHMTKNGPTVSVGASVTQGQTIGLSGNTGCSTAPHMHFEVSRSASSGADSTPVTFSNTATNNFGLQAGSSYTAL